MHPETSVGGRNSVTSTSIVLRGLAQKPKAIAPPIA